MELNPTWLQKARKFCGLTAKQLALMTSLSLNYIQRLEAGNRDASPAAKERIWKALGFCPADISFDSSPLTEKIQNLIAEHGESGLCTLEYIRLHGKIYFTNCEYVPRENLRPDCALSNILELQYARNNIAAQVILFEDPCSPI